MAFSFRQRLLGLQYPVLGNKSVPNLTVRVRPL